MASQLTLSPSEPDIEQFLERASGDSIQLVALPAGGGSPRAQWFGSNATEAAAWAATMNRDGHNLYWSVNRVRSGLNKKARKEDIEQIRYCHVDIDPPKDGGPFEKNDVVLQLELGGLMPSYIVDSGGGIQAFWRVNDDMAGEDAEAINREILAHFGGDNCQNIDRIMRVPGTVNYPDEKKRKAGRVPVMAREIGGFHTCRYSLEEIGGVFSDQAAAQQLSANHTSLSLELDGFDPRLKSLLLEPSGIDRSKDTFAAASEMLRQGFADWRIESVLLNAELPISAHCLGQKNPKRAAWRAINNARRDLGPTDQLRAIWATPYACPPPETIPLRRWVYGSHWLRGTLSLIVAPGGTGKTALTAGIALALATGRPLLGKDIPDGPQKVWLWNLEDPIDELHRSIAAACQHYGISRSDLVGQLFLDSGLEGQQLCTATQDRRGFAINQPVYDALVAEIRRRGINVLIVDPFVSSHHVSENDNGAIDAVAKAWARVAAEADCAVVLVHHTSKSLGNEITAERSRGAGALVNAARSVLVLNRMTSDEAQKLGASEADRRGSFRVVDDKNNRAPPADASDWYRIEGVTLPNGRDGECFGDSVGVVTPWTPPVMEPVELNDQQIAELQSVIAGGVWRENEQADQWAGQAVAAVYGLNINEKAGRQRAKRILKEALGKGWLQLEKGKDEYRIIKKFIAVGPRQAHVCKPLPVMGSAALLHLHSTAHSSTAADVQRCSAPPLGGTAAAAASVVG